MESKEFSQIRHYLGKSQRDLARILCVSPKTVQSFEQGLRHIPVHIEQQMLLFLSLKKMSSDEIITPCWEIKNCPSEWKEKCFVWELKARHLCWFINGTARQGQVQISWNQKLELCKECEVFQSLIPKTT